MRIKAAASCVYYVVFGNMWPGLCGCLKTCEPGQWSSRLTGDSGRRGLLTTVRHSSAAGWSAAGPGLPHTSLHSAAKLNQRELNFTQLGWTSATSNLQHCFPRLSLHIVIEFKKNYIYLLLFGGSHLIFLQI